MADETHRNDRRSRRQYPQEFQLEAVRLADSIGVNAAAERLGMPRATMSNWARRRRKVAYTAHSAVTDTPMGNTMPKRPAGELEAENARLRRELTNAKLDIDILRKAAAYFVRESR